MLQGQHIFSHQHQHHYPQNEPSWPHMQQNHQPQHSHQVAHHHAQAQAAAVAAAAAQHQHYNRIAANNNTNMGMGTNSDHKHGGGGGSDPSMSEENQRVLGWIAELMGGNSREAALLELSKKREQVPELALILWHSFGKQHPHKNIAEKCTDGVFDLGVMTSLLQEIISVYPLLNPSQLTAAASNRVCNALALLQCVASHNETRALFLNGSHPLNSPPNLANW